MIKIFLIIFFCALFFYGFIRPFSSLSSRLFLFSGSILGLLSVIGIEQTDKIANFVGVGRGADLFVYFSWHSLWSGINNDDDDFGIIIIMIMAMM